jgi:hypothetical protein
MRDADPLPARGRGAHTDGMGFAVFTTLPGLVIALTAVAFPDQALLRAGRAALLPWRNPGRAGQVSATGFERLHAALSPDRTHELRGARTRGAPAPHHRRPDHRHRRRPASGRLKA